MTSRRTRKVLVSFGTAGDVYPFIAIGSALRARGHDVVLVTHPRFHQRAADRGLRTSGVGCDRVYRRALHNPELWSRRRGLRTVMSDLLPDPLETYEVLSQLADEVPSLLVSHPFAFAARLLEEKRGVPCITVVLSACLFRSNSSVPVMVGAQDPSKMPRPLKWLMWWLADRLYIDPAVTPILNGARRKLGLPDVRRPFGAWIHAPELTIGLFPEWFAPPQPDWPRQTRLTGFARLRPRQPTSPEVIEFLDHRDPPIVFTCGSARPSMDRFVGPALEACRRIDRRALFLSPQPLPITIADPTRIHRARFAPLDEVLPSCAAIVHHGGIGTTAAALANATPQIVSPIAHDHFDHAARVHRLGVGRRLLAPHFDAGNLADAIEYILQSHSIAAQCRRRARMLRDDDALARTCELIEDMAHRTHPGRPGIAP